MSNPIICASLDDCNTLQDVFKISTTLYGKGITTFKIGSALYTLFGPSCLFTFLNVFSCKVFLDLKFHDTPNTMRLSAQNASKLGVHYITVHASAGVEAMKAAKEGADGKCKIFAVTVLTSLDSDEVTTLFGNDLKTVQESLVLAAVEAGVDGIVCSPLDIERIKPLLKPDMMIITPGIVLDKVDTTTNNSGQARTMSYQEALTIGSDMLVIGRSLMDILNILDTK